MLSTRCLINRQRNTGRNLGQEYAPGRHDHPRARRDSYPWVRASSAFERRGRRGKKGTSPLSRPTSRIRDARTQKWERI